MNVVVVKGRLSSRPRERELPSGDRLVAYEVTVPAEPGKRAESVPVVVLGEPNDRLEAGAEVVVVGRVRRRFFRAGAATASRTEVVADAVVAADTRRRVTAALRRATRAIESG